MKWNTDENSNLNQFLKYLDYKGAKVYENQSGFVQSLRIIIKLYVQVFIRIGKFTCWQNPNRSIHLLLKCTQIQSTIGILSFEQFKKQCKQWWFKHQCTVGSTCTASVRKHWMNGWLGIARWVAKEQKAVNFRQKKNIYYSLLIYELMYEWVGRGVDSRFCNEWAGEFVLIDSSLWHAWEWSDITAKQTQLTHGFMFHLMSARGFLIASKDCIVTHNL